MTACLEELPVRLGKNEAQLVVEGYINDRQEACRVRLSTLDNLDGTTTSTDLIDGAVVELELGDGRRVRFQDEGNGQYLTEAVRGRTGDAFRLHVRLSNGDEYSSDLQTIPEPVLMLSGGATLVEDRVETSPGNFRSVFRHDISVEILNTPNDHFYLIENSGWASVEIGYDCLDAFGGSPFCWSLRQPIARGLVVGSNQGFGSGNYRAVLFGVPFDYKRLYIANVRLHALSREQFLFWQEAQAQLDRTGGLFDRPFAPLVGNIRQTNGEKTALGYFFAYATDSQSICFDRNNVPSRIAPVPIIRNCAVLCTEVWNPATFENMEALLCE
ncbi:MAG: DUF4249 domain-containing protein [Bernardetiaceae bacterium]